MIFFYTYLWLREDGSPYYVGKGSGNRAFESCPRHHPPKDFSRIRVNYWLDEATALAYEVYLIDFWGRKDIGTGILRNRTDGGDAPPSQRGRTRSKAHREKIRQTLKRKGIRPPSRKGTKLSPVVIVRLTQSRDGYRHSKATKQKIGKANRGNKARSGQTNSAEHRQKISLALKARHSISKS